MIDTAHLDKRGFNRASHNKGSIPSIHRIPDMKAPYLTHRGVRVYPTEHSSFEHSTAHQRTFSWSAQHTSLDRDFSSEYLFEATKASDYGVFVANLTALYKGHRATIERALKEMIDAIIETVGEEDRPWYGAPGQMTEGARVTKQTFDREGFVQTIQELVGGAEEDHLMETFRLLRGGYVEQQGEYFYTEIENTADHD